MVVASLPCECGCRTLTNFTPKGRDRGNPQRFVAGHAGVAASAARRRLTPEQRRARKRAERERNHAAYLARDRARAAADPEGNRDRVAAWRKANPEKARLTRRKAQATRRARKRDAHVEQVDPVELFEMHEGACGICGEQIDGAFEVDHRMPLALGGEHSYANTQPAHPACNRRKGARCGV